MVFILSIDSAHSWCFVFGDYLRAAASITPCLAECCTDELHWGFVVTPNNDDKMMMDNDDNYAPIWPAIDAWLLPEEPWAAELITACREACCVPELKFGLLAAPR